MNCTTECWVAQVTFLRVIESLICINRRVNANVVGVNKSLGVDRYVVWVIGDNSSHQH